MATRRAVRIGAAGATALGVGYLLDRNVFASAGLRSARTIATAIHCAYLYKFCFVPGRFEEIHSTAANLVFDTCVANSGLYIKFGQQIASVATLLPPQWSRFKQLYDAAPAVPFDQVQAVIRSEFNVKEISDIFDNFEESPRASASIAQVHKATLKGSNLPVAVKVQKPAIPKQIAADLFCFSLVLYSLERVFDLKLTWMLSTIYDHLLQEVDFLHEADNSEKCAGDLKQIPEFVDSMHVPFIIRPLTTKRILTAEWIEATSFVDAESVGRQWGREKCDAMVTTLVNVFNDQIFRTGFVHCDPHPGNLLIRPRPSDPTLPQIVLLDHGLYTQCSPQFLEDYRGLWVSLFAHDIEKVETIVNKWGMRDVQMLAMGILQRPWSKTAGLKSANVLHDFLQAPGASSTTNSSSNSNTNASATTTTAVAGVPSEISPEQAYEMQAKMKRRLQQYLENEQLIPRELIFIGRNLNIVRSNNKLYGSPVNRINLMGMYAIKITESLKPKPNNPSFFNSSETFSTTVSRILLQPPTALAASLWHNLKILSTFAFFSASFAAARAWASLSSVYSRLLVWLGLNGGDGSTAKKGGEGFEEVLEEAVRAQIYRDTGILVDKNAFDA